MSPEHQEEIDDFRSPRSITEWVDLFNRNLTKCQISYMPVRGGSENGDNMTAAEALQSLSSAIIENKGSDAGFLLELDELKHELQ